MFTSKTLGLVAVSILNCLVYVAAQDVCGTHIKYHNPITLCSDGVSCRMADFCEKDSNPSAFCHIDTTQSLCLCNSGESYLIYRSNQGAGGSCATSGCSLRRDKRWEDPDTWLKEELFDKRMLHQERLEDNRAGS